MPFLSSAQKYDSLLFVQASQEFEQKNWRACDLTCEKIFFFSEDPQLVNNTMFLKSLISLNQEDYQTAYEEIMKINYSMIQSDSLRYVYRVNTALVAYLNDNYPEVNSAFNELKSDFPDSNGVFIDSFLDVFAFNMQWRFAEADTLLQQYFDKYNSQSTADILKIEAKNIYHHVPKKKSVKKARILAVISGLGHAYCGYYTEGLVSFGLNLSALAFTGGCIYSGLYVTSFFIGGSLLSQFTFGSFARAEKLVLKRNNFRVNKFNQIVTNFVLPSKSF